jgi:2-dehydro-3-deoxygluconokinase
MTLVVPMPEVVTAGESMILVCPAVPGRLRHMAQLDLRIGGAESNLAIALARLGLSVGWVSWLGQEEPGEVVLGRIRAEGVDTSQVRRIDAPTGLYLRERPPEGIRVYYYRRGSAASLMGPGAFDPAYLEGAYFLHLTGITPALSDSCRQFVPWAMSQARARGVRVSYDINYRSKLWAQEAARTFTEEVLPLVDVLFLSHEDSLTLWGRADGGLLEHLAGGGPGEVLLQRGSQGCFARVNGTVLEHPAFPVPEVDAVGAGDAFAAGYLAGALWGLAPQERLRTANALGAYSVMCAGDYEGLPMRSGLRAFLEGSKTLGR